MARLGRHYCIKETDVTDLAFDIKEIQPEPEFDLWLYAEIAGETRFADALMHALEESWNRWKDHLKAVRLVRKQGKGDFLVVWLEEPVEAEVEAKWDESPTDGLSLHNLAVTMVMGAARAAIPELEENKCAPMPKPTGSIQDAFEALGMEWNSDGTIDRKYAVFTFMPYKGGCEICFLEEDCPSSKMEKKWGRNRKNPS